MTLRWAWMALAMAVAYGVQLWSAMARPDAAEQAELVRQLVGHVQADDELAYLPGWEQAWALKLQQALPGHRQRLGADDLLRPAPRLWILRAKGRPLPAGLPEASQALQSGRYVASLHQRPGAQPEAWPRLGSCQMSAKRRRCAAGGASLSHGELNFDGRFARGLKMALPEGETSLTFQPKAAATLVGAIGFTGHGARQASQGFSWRIGAGPWRHGQPDLGLWPIEAAGPVQLTFRSGAKKPLELGLLLGWLP